MVNSLNNLGASIATAATVASLAVALAAGSAQAQDKTFVMKITTPTLNAALDQYANVYARRDRERFRRPHQA